MYTSIFEHWSLFMQVSYAILGMQLVLVTNVLYQSCMAVSPDQSIQPAFGILIFMGSNIKFNSSDVSIQNDPNLRYIAS